jgi:hypothetical protein
MIRLAAVASVGHSLVVELPAAQLFISDAGEPDDLFV